ncbi:hypothetical protein BJ508DRAFT_50034 [Ascobolus immersus RN42]|uniref:Uncharacterized protein n=1 Tax=Ascobolus immersus RN42 TaxID=1160509 RepID=A0A3N4HLM1_ASCIM|nr:hypothetical protein BJ508DRAFT_50034 [Ascobolus immersus RN42]
MYAGREGSSMSYTWENQLGLQESPKVRSSPHPILFNSNYSVGGQQFPPPKTSTNRNSSLPVSPEGSGIAHGKQYTNVHASNGAFMINGGNFALSLLYQRSANVYPLPYLVDIHNNSSTSEPIHVQSSDFWKTIFSSPSPRRKRRGSADDRISGTSEAISIPSAGQRESTGGSLSKSLPPPAALVLQDVVFSRDCQVNTNGSCLLQRCVIQGDITVTFVNGGRRQCEETGSTGPDFTVVDCLAPSELPSPGPIPNQSVWRMNKINELQGCRQRDDRLYSSATRQEMQEMTGDTPSNNCYLDDTMRKRYTERVATNHGTTQRTTSWDSDHDSVSSNSYISPRSLGGNRHLAAQTVLHDEVIFELDSDPRGESLVVSNNSDIAESDADMFEMRGCLERFGRRLKMLRR